MPVVAITACDVSDHRRRNAFVFFRMFVTRARRERIERDPRVRHPTSTYQTENQICKKHKKKKRNETKRKKKTIVILPRRVSAAINHAERFNKPIGTRHK